jgi:hypothetical protein
MRSFYTEAPRAIREVCGVVPPLAALHQFNCVLRETKYSHDVGTRWQPPGYEPEFNEIKFNSLNANLIVLARRRLMSDCNRHAS